MRRRVHEILTNPRASDRAGRLVSAGLLALIAVNVVANALETDVELAARAGSGFFWLEVVSVALFTLEYALRLWSCTADPRFAAPLTGRLRFAVQPMSLVDLAAIVPFYFDVFLAGTLDLRFLRAMRLLRLFRLLRARRLASAFGLLTRVVQAKRADLGVTLALVCVAIVVAAGAIYTAEHGEPNTAFTSIPRAMWWSVVTITTVGYGDMAPVTPIGQVIGGIVAVLGICALALPVGILSTGFFDELNRVRAAPVSLSRVCPHCGSNIDDRAEVGSS